MTRLDLNGQIRRAQNRAYAGPKDPHEAYLKGHNLRQGGDDAWAERARREREAEQARASREQARQGQERNAKEARWRSSVFTAAALQEMEFPPISYVIPGLIPEGLTILAGRPKIGKSWAALELAIGVASHKHVLGDIEVAQRRCSLLRA
jgi:hypothetical protein